MTRLSARNRAGSGGDIWVTDSAKSKIFQLSSTGEVKSQFGNAARIRGRSNRRKGLQLIPGAASTFQIPPTSAWMPSTHEVRLGVWNGQGAQAPHVFKRHLV